MRILLVDDDQLIRFVHQMFIERAGHEVVGVAEEETQAVRMALELKPDLVIMDIRLEDGTNGISAMHTIQQTCLIKELRKLEGFIQILIILKYWRFI